MPSKEIHEDFTETLGKYPSSYSTVRKCAAEFKRERECVDNDGRSGRLKDATTDEYVKVVHTLVMCDRRRDLRGIASEVGIHYRAVQSIITNILGMSKVSAKWVLGMLTNDPKKTWLDISGYLLSHHEYDPSDFIERVVATR